MKMRVYIIIHILHLCSEVIKIYRIEILYTKVHNLFNGEKNWVIN